jgi:DNA-binding IclR family transcriptional regulator
MIFDNDKFIQTNRSPMPNKRQTNRKVIASVQNALKILNLFEGNRSEMGNTEIANLLDMNPATVAGLVYTLKTNHYLDQNPANRKYRLGLKIAERASVLLNQLDLRKAASPYLEELRDWCGESVNLAILDDKEVVYIERMFGHHALGIRSELGKRAPMHSTSLGKAIAAFLPEQDLRVLLEDYQFSSITRETITDQEVFNQELEIIRKCGYAMDEQENEMGGRCIGVPIFNHEGYPIAALSLSVPVQRLPNDQVPSFGEKLKQTALLISKQIGYQP